MNRYCLHVLLAAWMLGTAGSAVAQCQAGMATIPGAGCVPREVVENQGRSYQQPQSPPPDAPPPMRQIDFTPVAAVVEYGAHAITSDNATLFGAAGNITAVDAEDTAVGFCQEKTGKPCRSLGFFRDTCQVFAFDQNNTPYRGVDNDPRKAAGDAMNACAQAGGKAQCRLWKLPVCAGNNYVNSDFTARKEWGPGEYEARVQAWTEETRRGQ